MAARGRQSLTYHSWSRFPRSALGGVGQARQQLPFPEENPTKVAGTRGILAGARSHPFPRPMNHKIQRSKWDVSECVLGPKGAGCHLRQASAYAHSEHVSPDHTTSPTSHMPIIPIISGEGTQQSTVDPSGSVARVSVVFWSHEMGLGKLKSPNKIFCKLFLKDPRLISEEL